MQLLHTITADENDNLKSHTRKTNDNFRTT